MSFNRFLTVFGAKALFDVLFKHTDLLDTLRLSLCLTGSHVTYSKIQNPILGGGLASLWLLFDKPSRRVWIGEALLVRSVWVVLRQLFYVEKHGHLELKQSHSKVLNWIAKWIDRFGDLAVWHTVAYVICYNVVNHVDRVPIGYMRSIMGMSGQRKVFKDKALDILRIQEQMMEKPDFNPRVSSETTRSYIQSLDRDWLNPLLPFIPARVKHFHLGCAVSHPQTGSCHLAMMKQWLTCMKQVAPLYLVTNAAPILLGKLRQLYAHKHHSKKDPKNHHSLRRFLVSYVRSCIMMSTYIACFFYFGCLLRRIGDYKTNMGLAGLLAGPAVLLERDGRITELNQYSVGNAVEMIKARQQIRSFGTWYLPVLFGYLGYVKRNHSGLLQGTLKIGLQILM